MIYIITIVSLCAIYFLIRYLHLRKQLKSIISQLHMYNKQSDNMMLSITLSDHHIENLAIEINTLIASQTDINADRLRTERELKQAISGMSHDLRTPLTSIKGYIQLIKKGNLPTEKVDEYMQVIEQRANRLQNLIDHFFALSTIDSDDYPLLLESTELNSVVDEVLLSLYDQFQAADQIPTINVSKEKIMIVTDQVACKRVIENIILNAILHSAGDISVCLERENNFGVLSVRNKIDVSKIPDMNQLFDRFYVEDSTRRYGRGLGLSIVRGLMEGLDGEVEAELVEDYFTVICKWKIA